MNEHILKPAVQDFILEHFKSDYASMAFKGSPFENVGTAELLQQLKGKKKAQKKFPLWFNTKAIYYPPTLNLEQTSSQTAALYKASLFEGHSMADLTGGFGIDSYFFSKRFKEVVHFETNLELTHIAAHNFSKLKATNVQCLNEDGIQALEKGSNYDLIYIDPSRRHTQKGKVFMLSDCLPNVPEYLELLFKHSSKILIKTSPMLDIDQGLRELKHVAQIHIVAIANEVKELLWILDKDAVKAPKIIAVNLKKDERETFAFNYGENPEAAMALPKLYLYEPNAAILKSGAFNSVASRFNIHKLHTNTHLYTSDQQIEFPGRCFLIEKNIPYSKKALRNAFTFNKANVSTRNFSLSVAELKKKWGLKDGGDHYLFFTTLQDSQKAVLICKKTVLKH